MARESGERTGDTGGRGSDEGGRRRRRIGAGRAVVALGSLLLVGVLGAAGCGDAFEEQGASETDGETGEAREEAVAASTPNLCLTIRNGQSAGGVTYKTFDTYISAEKTGDNYGTGSFDFTGATTAGAAVPFQTLFKVDLSFIPTDATVLSAALVLNQTSTGAATINVHKILGAWSEGTVTWSSFGGAYDPLVSKTFSSAPASVSVDLKPIAQAWINASLANNGVLLEQAGAFKTTFKSKRYAVVAQQPYVTLCYNVVCAAGRADCNNSAADGCETNVTSPASCGACGNVCASGVCANGACQAPTCFDGVKNGNETGIDCGGACAKPEVCNGIDDDCNGQVDEGLGSTTCGVGACSVTVQNCAGGVAQNCAPRAPSVEICDGIDNDCDGSIDEDLPAITCGVGACSVTVPACVNGVPGLCDAHATDGIPCEDGHDCTAADACIAGACAGTTLPAGTVCRASAGACDVAEACTGAALDCPADTLSTAGTICRFSAGSCDVAEACDGASAACPTDTLIAAGTVCRASLNECDLGESCTGASAACPADAVVVGATACTGDADPCTTDLCNGAVGAPACVHTMGNACPGGTLFAKLWGSSDTDGGRKVAVDAQGFVYTTGLFAGTVDFGAGPVTSAGLDDAVIIKTDAAGNPVWSRTFGGIGHDIGNGIAVDAQGNLIVVGWFQNTVDFGNGPLTSAGGYDMFMLKMTAGGQVLWSKRVGGTGTQDVAWDMTLDAQNNIYITGSFAGTTNLGAGNINSAGNVDAFVAKYDAGGVYQWAKRWGGTGPDLPHGIAVGPSGEVVVAGTFQNTVNFGTGNKVSAGAYDLFVVKLTAAGAITWVKTYGNALYNVGEGAAIDAAGNVIVTGYSGGNVDLGAGVLVGDATDYDAFVLKLDPNGGTLWSKLFGSLGADQIGMTADTNAAGEIVLTGYFNGTIGFGGPTLTSKGLADMYVTKLDPSGAQIYSHRFGGEGNDYAYDLALGAAGQAYLTGYFSGTDDLGFGPLSSSAGSSDIALIELAP